MEILILFPAAVLGTMIAFGIALHYRDKHGTWAGPARLIFFGWLGLITLDIPLKLASLAIHCAFWTGFHVEPGKVLQDAHYYPPCDAECVRALVSKDGTSIFQTVSRPTTQWTEGQTWDVRFTLSDDGDQACRLRWSGVVEDAVKAGLNLELDPSLCLRSDKIAGSERPARYELRDDVNQTNPDNIFWLTFKRGLEVWDIEADRLVAWFGAYEIRLWWLYPLELGCPADRSFMHHRGVAVLEPIRVVRP